MCIYYKNSSSSSSYSTYCYIYNVTKGSSIKSNGTVSSTSYTSVSFSANAGDIIYIRNYRYDFDYFERFRKFQELTPGLGNRMYGDIERLPEVPYLMATLGTYDIYEGSSEIRSILMGRNKSYTNNNQYAIGAETTDNSKFDYFSVNEKVSDFISKVTKGKGGSTIDHYYREHDEGGSPDIKKGENKSWVLRHINLIHLREET